MSDKVAYRAVLGTARKTPCTSHYIYILYRRAFICYLVLFVEVDQLLMGEQLLMLGRDIQVDTLHCWLRPIDRGQFGFANFAPHFEGKCHFHFLTH